jgi:Tfp pilus assembly protein PilO
MLRFILPMILIGLSITGFVVFVSPTMGEISTLKSQIASYDKALDNSKSLDIEREKLTKKYNSIDPNNLTKLEKLLPDNVDNIRLILEVEKLASPYGMVLRDVKYDTIKKTEEDKQPTEVFQGGDTNIPTQSDYGTWDLEFSTEGSYTNFLSFLRDLESNLRIVDISSIQFSSVTGAGINTPVDVYKYGFKVKTYWMKN